MKRSGYIRRKTPLARSTTRIERRTPVRKVADVRAGFDRIQIWELEALARGCVMIRDNATYAVDYERLTISWLGACRECGLERPLDWSHVIARSESPRLVYVPLNAIAHCRRCHDRWHGAVLAGFSKAVHILGTEAVDRLIQLDQYGGQRYDQGAQRLANAQWLRDHAPDLLREIQELTQQRCDRFARRLSSKRRTA